MNGKKIDKKQIEYLVAGVAIVIFLSIMFMPKSKPLAVYQQATESVGMVMGVLGEINKIQRDSYAIPALDQDTTGAASDRDPFDILVETSTMSEKKNADEGAAAPVAEEEYPAPEIVVQGILYEARNPAASTVMIDGEEYNVGKVVKDWVIESIQQEQIVLRRGKQQHTIKLY